MDVLSSDACLGTAGCRPCITENCYYLQFDTGNWICTAHLVGWKNVQRVIGRNFEELCDRISTTVAPLTDSVVDSLHHSEYSCGMIWTFSLADIFLLLLFVIGFIVLCRRDRRLIDAIGEIPDQVRLLHARNNNYYLQLQQQERDARNITSPPIALPPPQPADLQLVPTNGPLSPNHSHIDMEGFDEEETSFSTPESSPEAPPRENFITKFGRLVRIPPRF